MTGVRSTPWLLRGLWVALVVAAGADLAAALDGRSAAVRATATVGLWAGWAVVLCASLVFHPVSLTVTRLGAPAAVGACAAAGSVVGVAVAVAVLAVALLPEVGVAFVNGPAYANERRFPLRAPGPLLLGPLPLAVALTIGAPAAGALLLAARAWVAGAAVLVVGVPVAALLGRALHGLSRRWVVFVPAGLVLHDPMTLADPVLFRRADVVALRPAPADTPAVDLTARAFGLALQLDLRDPAALALVRAGSRTADTTEAASLLFSPTRPGSVLAEAGRRRLPAG